mgnify:CR=1 FL=1
MLDIRLDPLLWQSGPLGLSWHGLWLTVALIAAYQVVAAAASRQGHSRETIAELMLWAGLAGLAGARGFHVLDEWAYYGADLGRVLALHRGGLSSLGAIAGGIVALILFTRRHALSFWALADLSILGIPVAELVGRIGCTIQGDVHGLPTGAGWGYVYWHPQAAVPRGLLGVPTYPTPLFLQLWALLLLLILLWLRPRLQRPGALFLAGLAFYALGRFLIGFVRAGNPYLLGLTQAQIVAVLIMVAAAVLAAWRRRETAAPSGGAPG